MTTLLSPRDIEMLSAYLDGYLTGSEVARLESRLQEESELRTTLEEMRRTRAILRSAPVLRAPRNYTLKPGMVKERQQAPRAYPILRLASALATALFVLTFVGDLIGRGAPTLAPVAVLQQVEVTEAAAILEEAASTEQMQMQSQAPSAPAAPAAELALEPLSDQAATETAIATGTQMAMFATLPTATPASDQPGLGAGDALRQAVGTQPELPAVQDEAEGRSEITIKTSPSWWSSLRIFEAIILIIALATGVAAFFVRRTGSG